MTKHNLVRWLALVPISAAFAVSSSWAQAVDQNTPETPTKASAATPKVAVEKASAPTPDETIVLSPFVVTSDDDKGYMASNTMSGTRINTKVEDLGASISVVNKQQLMDTAAIDINDIFSNEANTEGIYQYTEFQIDGKGNAVDTAGVDPNKANRVRGLGAANLAVGGYASASGLPIDTYNIEAVEISRGPNSSIFGLGESSGTVNLIGAAANTTRQITNMQLRTDSYGGYRSSFDINRPIVKDKLAIRFLGVYEEKGYVRSPSQDTTKRWQLAITAKPFKYTTIRASYEDYRNTNSRPNTVTPRDFVTPWIAAGMPTYRPLEQAVYKNGVKWSPNATWAAASFKDRWTKDKAGFIFSPDSGLGEPGGSAAYSRPNMWVDNGQVVYYSNGARPADLGATVTTEPGPTVNTGNYFEIASGVIFSAEKNALWRPVGISDKSLYDWENINYSAPNIANKYANTTKIELEQYLLHTPVHQLAFQAGYFGENSYEYRRNWVGQADGANSAVIVDINETRLDGTANPYFRHTYVAGGEPQAYIFPVENKNYRGTLAYQLDLTRQKSFWRWLGRNNFVYYGEQRDQEYSPNGLRYRDYITSDHPWIVRSNNDKRSGNQGHVTYRFYNGDASGYNVDYAPLRPDTFGGNRNLYWYNGRTKSWTTETVSLEELYFAIGMEQKQIRTRGYMWQGSFLKNRIKWLPDLEVIPTVGGRKDYVATRQPLVYSAADSIDANGYPIMSNQYNFQSAWATVISGKTTTKGVVFRPFKWISFHYNKSDSFKPESMAYTIFNEPLANPTGKGKDYGITLNLWDGKFVVRVNKYEVLDVNARNGAMATLGTRPPRIDFDTRSNAWDEDVATSSYDGFNVEKSLFKWALAADHRTAASVADLDATSQRALVEQYMAKVWQSPYLKDVGLEHAQFVRNLNGATVADVNNIESKGYEIELNYNPSKYLSIKGTVTKQQAIDKELSANVGKYFAWRMPVWKSIVIPANLEAYDADTATWGPDANAGLNWWTTKVGTLDKPSDFFSAIDAGYALATANAGKPRGQTREWRYNMTGRYSLAAISENKILKHTAVGGSYRWEDKAVIGYLAAAPDADGVYRRYDASKPVYDKARDYVDLFFTYDFKLWSDKVGCRLQFNVRNVFENGRLQVIGINPDGQARDFRIIDPRQYIMSLSFDL